MRKRYSAELFFLCAFIMILAVSWNIPRHSASVPAWTAAQAPPDTPHGLLAYYYNNRIGNNVLWDTLKVTQIDPQINFDWGGGSPFPDKIRNDYFSARWIGYIKAKVTGTYTFHTRSDDGARLIIGGLIVIDYWNTCCRDFTGQIYLEAGKLYPIIYEMVEKTGGAAANYLDWEAPGLARELVPTENLYAIAPPHSDLYAAQPKPDVTRDTTNGLIGSYFNDALGNQVWLVDDSLQQTRIDPNINFGWASGSAMPGRMERIDNFSVRWTGFLRAPVTGTYTFLANSDDGGRLFINGNKIIDYWGSCCSYVSSTISLIKGNMYAFTFEMHEIGGGAGAYIRWSVENQISEDFVPQSAFYTTYVPPVAQTAFSPSEGYYEDSVKVRITTATKGAEIHYTLDGSTPTESSPLYSDSLIIRSTATLNALAFHKDMLPSLVESRTYTIVPPLVSTPVFSPTANVFDTAQVVTITTAEPDTKIYYTLDGSDPKESGAVLYTGPIHADSTTIIKAYATKENFSDSKIATALFIVTKETTKAPKFSVEGGRYTASQTVTITNETPGAVIRYTVDGKLPDVSSPVYSAPIQITKSATLSAYAQAPRLLSSQVTSATYFINEPMTPVDTPRPSIPPGTYTAVQQLILTTSTRAAEIHYTTDGSEPTENSALYKNPISLIKDSMVVKAIAFKEGMSPSSIVSFTYLLDPDGVDKNINTTLSPTSLAISPNPATDMVRIKWDGLIYTNSKIHLVITDSKGMVVHQADIAVEKAFYEFSTRLLSSGVYFVKVISGSSSATGKLIVNR